MSLRQQLIDTTRAWVKAHDDRDPAAIKALTAPDFTAHFNPRSLPAQGIKDGEGYAQFQAQAFPLFASYHVTEVDLVVDEAQLKTVVYLDAQGVADVPGLADPTYKNQYVHKMTFTEDGKLVQRFDSFIDGQTTMVFMGKVFAAQGAAAGASEDK